MYLLNIFRLLVCPFNSWAGTVKTISKYFMWVITLYLHIYFLPRIVVLTYKHHLFIRLKDLFSICWATVFGVDHSWHIWNNYFFEFRLDLIFLLFYGLHLELELSECQTSVLNLTWLLANDHWLILGQIYLLVFHWISWIEFSFYVTQRSIIESLSLSLRFFSYHFKIAIKKFFRRTELILTRTALALNWTSLMQRLFINIFSFGVNHFFASLCVC